ncbi:hypothetical protein Bhyg_13368, partial [Pseudolycoriella hygida]
MDWCKRQPHLPNLNELEIIVYLHSCYNSLEAAKVCIDTAFTIRTHCPDFFANRDVLGKDVEGQMGVMLFTPLPGLTPEGYKPIYTKIINSDPSKFVFSDAVKLLTMVTDLCVMEEGTAKGYIIVADMNGVLLGHLAKLGILTIKKYMLYLQESERRVNEKLRPGKPKGAGDLFGVDGNFKKLDLD